MRKTTNDLLTTMVGILRRINQAGEPLFPEARIAIRGALADGPLHGYELAKRLTISHPQLFENREGMLYPVLHDMERRGELRTETVEEKGRTRRYYKLTTGQR